MPIINAKDKPLSQVTGSLPNVSGAMQNWFQKMRFIRIVKQVLNFQVIETPVPIDFMGVWQPFSAAQMALKPEGQRTWSWFMLHSEVGLPLQNDDVVKYQEVNYRIMEQSDYTPYGYMEYHLVEDYTGGTLIDSDGIDQSTPVAP